MDGKQNDMRKLERLRQQYSELNVLRQEYRKVEMSEEQVEEIKRRMEGARREKESQKRKRVVRNALVAAAAVAVVFVALPNMSASVAYAMSNIPIVGRLVDVVTFRDYQYTDDRNNADIEVPELVTGEMTPGTESMSDTEAVSEDTGALPDEVQENLNRTAEEINAEIQKITEGLIAEFEAGLAEDGGYQDMMVTSEILATSQNYFTLKLICYQAAGSGAEWDYFYTIDLSTGERLALADLFVAGSDYLTPITENIKEQMRRQMAEDESKMYWVDNEDDPGWNFEGITDETSFYLNTDDNIVICFNEGDVAPMYMGTVEFEIPAKVVADIRR